LCVAHGITREKIEENGSMRENIIDVTKTNRVFMQHIDVLENSLGFK
uniref:Major urinary protein (Fragments) n=1 Tax=Rattus rattus TaxID=10117 RepID=MUP_RATRT|nr:RecName: Full=Major urinary protein; Short=MUP; AltName: Full=Alpha(2)-euglobulin; AltName: Full=Alpha-2u-globulin [Rattus rattus]